jgi:hypothetical protein
MRSCQTVITSDRKNPMLDVDAASVPESDTAGVQYPLSQKLPSSLRTTSISETSIVKHTEMFPNDDAKDVEMTLDWLTRFAIEIRKTGIRYRDLRAEEYKKNGDQVSSLREDTRDLLDSIRLSGLFRKVKRTVLDPTQKMEIPNLLRDRIIECNANRRCRFLYAQDHDKKLRAGTLVVQKQTSLSRDHDKFEAPNSNKLKETEIQPIASKAAPQTTNVPKSMVTMSSQPSTAATPLDRAVYAPPPPQSQDGALYPSSPGSEGTFVPGKLKMVYPSPPEVDYSSNFFQCPYCRQLVSRQTAEKDKWRYANSLLYLAYGTSVINCMASG